MFAQLLVGFRSLLFPAACVGCGLPLSGGQKQPLCPPCLGKLPRRRFPWSGKVGASRFSFDRAASPWAYEATARELVLALKYRGRLSLVPFLAAAMGRAVREQISGEPAEAVVPVPLHPTRLRERSFNQAEVLARALAAELHLPLRTDLLARRRPTLPQVELSKKERRSNVEEAFVLRPGVPVPKRLLLVDDILTTGATAEQCARLLKRAGASTVDVVTLAQG